MSYSPRIRYFLADSDHPVHENDDIWSADLPLHRNGTEAAMPADIQGKHRICYGDYFLAVRTFLEKNNFGSLISAIESNFKAPHKPADPANGDTLDIFLEKHGAFYHPARIEWVVAGQKNRFVVNVAVSIHGRRNIVREHTLLKKLNREISPSFLPEIYDLYPGVDHGDIKESGIIFPMFLAEWLDGFHEFHCSLDKTDGEKKTVVWDTTTGAFFLSQKQKGQLYREIAKVLTCYYNLETFEQIYPWHHAAGDFVIQPLHDSIGVRLITVRNYISLIKTDIKDPATILNALLIFLLNLSIRTRVDRLDGVGDLTWADDIAVRETVRGFLMGLALKPQTPALPEMPMACFQYYMSRLSKEEIHELSCGIVGSYHPNSPEINVIKHHLENHTEILFRYLTSQCEI